MQETSRSLERDRLSVLIAVVLLGLVLFRFIELPQRTLELNPFGSPLRIELTGTWLLVALMAGLACMGTNLVLHQHPYLVAHPERPVYVFWILPAMIAGLSAYLLQLAPSWQVWGVGLAGTAVLLGLTIGAEYTAAGPDSPGFASVRLGLNILAYTLAFILFGLVYQSRARSLVTATLISLVAFAIALDLLGTAEARHSHLLLFAGAIALVIGESTWALNYWRINAWVGGLVLLLILYAFTNIAYQHLLQRLTPSTIVEFAGVGVIVLVVVLLSA